MGFKRICTSWWISNYIDKTFLLVVSEYRHQKATSNNAKAFVHILVNFFSCAVMFLAWKFEFKIVAETPQTKGKE